MHRSGIKTAVGALENFFPRPAVRLQKMPLTFRWRLYAVNFAVKYSCYEV